MSLGSSAPLWFGHWLKLICWQLLVGGPPACPPVAFDGIGGDAPADSVATATFVGSTLTRSDGGDFVADGWRDGMIAAVAGSTDNDGTYHVVVHVTPTVLLFFETVAFVAESSTADVTIHGTVPTGFALYVGPQWLQRWDNPPVCVIVPSEGTPADAMAFRTAGPRRVLGAIGLGADIYIWGGEDAANLEASNSIWHDIERYTPACDALQNVLRAVYYAANTIGMGIATVGAWSKETEIQRFGEDFVLHVDCSFPIYDFEETGIPSPMAFEPGVNVRQPGEPLS